MICYRCKLDNKYCKCSDVTYSNVTTEGSDSKDMLDEVFDIDMAIGDKGNCHRQDVKCENCKIGKTIFEANGKSRIDDLCDKDMVYFCAKVVKNFD